jgi:hypothetical protein
MVRTSWIGPVVILRIALAGVVWMVVYNLVWGAAWFAFMRREWLDAVAAINQGLPWTPDVLALWGALSLPFGVATMAYATSQPRDRRAKTSVQGSVALWFVMTLGMTGWAVTKPLPIRLIAFDSAVNLVAIVVASLAGARFALAR